LHFDSPIESDHSIETLLNDLVLPDISGKTNDRPTSKIIIDLLVPPSHSHLEVVPGSLKKYRMLVVNRLLEIRQTQPKHFNKIWEELEYAFRNVHRNTQVRYPLRDVKSLTIFSLESYEQKHNVPLLKYLDSETAIQLLVKERLRYVLDDFLAAGTAVVLIYIPLTILIKLILRILFNRSHSFNHTKVVSL